MHPSSAYHDAKSRGEIVRFVSERSMKGNRRLRKVYFSTILSLALWAVSWVQLLIPHSTYVRAHAN